MANQSFIDFVFAFSELQKERDNPSHSMDLMKKLWSMAEDSFDNLVKEKVESEVKKIRLTTDRR